MGLAEASLLESSPGISIDASAPQGQSDLQQKQERLKIIEEFQQAKEQIIKLYQEKDSSLFLQQLSESTRGTKPSWQEAVVLFTRILLELDEWMMKESIPPS